MIVRSSVPSGIVLLYLHHFLLDAKLLVNFSESLQSDSVGLELGIEVVTSLLKGESGLLFQSFLVRYEVKVLRCECRVWPFLFEKLTV